MMGFMPVNVGEGYDGFDCGSAFVQSEDLTQTGHETCLIIGGGANRRAVAHGMVTAGGIMLVGVLLSGFSLVPADPE